MHEYDIALKSVLQRLTGKVLRELTGFTVTRWHNAELPAVQSRRADMLGETADGKLLHIELQSTNQSGMALRMLEYATAIQRQFGQFPQQVVLYVGKANLRMKCDLKGPHLAFHCRIVDIRELDGDRLIASGRVEDNVIAVLGWLRDESAAVRRVLGRIAACGPRRRGLAFKELMLLAGLRNLEPLIHREVTQMPILNDIMDHKILGPERRRGIAIGLEKGERLIVLQLISQRFGPLPVPVRNCIETMPAPRLQRISRRLLDARSLDELMSAK